jgi:hypothetical protein
MNKRVIFGLILGAILGIFCIVGASLRTPDEASWSYLFSFWFNRVLMGFMIGLFPRPKNIKIALVRGISIGAFVSFAFYSATAFGDLTGFIAGFIYGMIIESILFYKVKD